MCKSFLKHRIHQDYILIPKTVLYTPIGVATKCYVFVGSQGHAKNLSFW